MSKEAKSLERKGISGGPEEDRTPDLLIANDTINNDINHLRPWRDAINSPKTGGECTNRAQLSAAILEHLHELSIVHNPEHPDRQIPPFDVRGLDILDIGCGIGQTLVARELAGARSYHGVDVNAEAIAYGMERFPHLRLQHAPAESLPYADGSFDLVYSRVAIPYTDIPRALAEARRVLRPGGQLWISLHGWTMERRQIAQARSLKKWLFRVYVWTNSLLFHFTGRTFRHPLHGRTTCLQTRGGITRALQRAGFHGIDLREEGPHFSARASRLE